MISRQVLDNGKVTSVTKCKHFGFVQRKQNVSAMERGQQTNCQRTNLKPNPVEFAPGHSKCLALVRFGPYQPDTVLLGPDSTAAIFWRAFSRVSFTGKLNFAVD